MDKNAIIARLDEIKKDQVRIEKLIAKQEENDVYDGDLYDSIDRLEDERTELRMMLESMGEN